MSLHSSGNDSYHVLIHSWHNLQQLMNQDNYGSINQTHSKEILINQFLWSNDIVTDDSLQINSIKSILMKAIEIFPFSRGIISRCLHLLCDLLELFPTESVNININLLIDTFMKYRDGKFSELPNSSHLDVIIAFMECFNQILNRIELQNHTACERLKNIVFVEFILKLCLDTKHSLLLQKSSAKFFSILIPFLTEDVITNVIAWVVEVYSMYNNDLEFIELIHTIILQLLQKRLSNEDLCGLLRIIIEPMQKFISSNLYPNDTSIWESTLEVLVGAIRTLPSQVLEFLLELPHDSCITDSMISRVDYFLRLPTTSVITFKFLMSFIHTYVEPISDKEASASWKNQLNALVIDQSLIKILGILGDVLHPWITNATTLLSLKDLQLLKSSYKETMTRIKTYIQNSDEEDSNNSIFQGPFLSHEIIEYFPEDVNVDGNENCLHDSSMIELTALDQLDLVPDNPFPDVDPLDYLVELNRISQAQAQEAISQADNIHKLFLESTKRVEELESKLAKGDISASAISEEMETSIPGIQASQYHIVMNGIFDAIRFSITCVTEKEDIESSVFAYLNDIDDKSLEIACTQLIQLYDKTTILSLEELLLFIKTIISPDMKYEDIEDYVRTMLLYITMNNIDNYSFVFIIIGYLLQWYSGSIISTNELFSRLQMVVTMNNTIKSPKKKLTSSLSKSPSRLLNNLQVPFECYEIMKNQRQALEAIYSSYCKAYIVKLTFQEFLAFAKDFEFFPQYITSNKLKLLWNEVTIEEDNLFLSYDQFVIILIKICLTFEKRLPLSDLSYDSQIIDFLVLLQSSKGREILSKRCRDKIIPKFKLKMKPNQISR